MFKLGISEIDDKIDTSLDCLHIKREKKYMTVLSVVLVQGPWCGEVPPTTNILVIILLLFSLGTAQMDVKHPMGGGPDIID